MDAILGDDQTSTSTIVGRLWGFRRSISDQELQQRLSLIEDEVLPRTGIELSDLAQVLKTSYVNPGAVMKNGEFNADIDMDPGPAVIIDSAASDEMPGQLSKMRLRLRNGSPVDLDRLRRLQIFIRLWKHLSAVSYNWDVENIDLALMLTKGLRFENYDHNLQQMDSISQISQLTSLSISQVLVLIYSMPMSLYQEIFMRHNLKFKDPIFE